MNTKNEDPKPTDNMEALKQEASACDPGCGCHAAGPSNRVRWIVGVIIILAAGALVARAIIKNNGASAEKAMPSFASLPTVEQTPVPLAGAVSATSAPRQAEGPSGRLPGDAATNDAPAAPVTVAVKELGALTELNAMAADTDGVFVFLPAKNEPLIKAPLAQMRSAARTIESQARIKIGLFRLKTDSPDYAQVAAQMPVPGVLAMVKGCGMIPVSGDITETKLIQGFVAASSGGGCGPSSAGCGPAGCN
ncbi:MAG: hypothetical protein KKD33_04070 [Verrucomicrobia bacterium]|nr:hypothetical protein [Verrucomicrobiota bacterium]MBU4285590.1 hypothetical protein [Verrucomicrobiota bacterium]